MPFILNKLKNKYLIFLTIILKTLAAYGMFAAARMTIILLFTRFTSANTAPPYSAAKSLSSRLTLTLLSLILSPSHHNKYLRQRRIVQTAAHCNADDSTYFSRV